MPQVCKVLLELLAHQDLEAQQDFKEPPVLEQQVQAAPQAQLVLLDCPVLQVQELQVHQEPLGQLEHREPQEQAD